MGTFNGYIGTTSTALANASLSMQVNSAVPAKYFTDGMFAINIPTTGLSGKFGVQIYGSVAGVSFPIAGATNLGATAGGSGSLPIPNILYVGYSGGNNTQGFPRPSQVVFQPVGASWPIAFTATVTMCGAYGG